MVELKLDDFRLRLVEEDDATFILELRTNKDLSKHLSKVSYELESQKNWIKEYKEREKQAEEYYFISETYNGEKLGLNRLYNFSKSSFVLGSWIFKKGIKDSIPILADLTVRDFAYEKLGFKICNFDVRKSNKSVLRYHLLFKPKLLREEEMDLFFELDYETYQKHKQKILKVLNHG